MRAGVKQVAHAADEIACRGVRFQTGQVGRFGDADGVRAMVRAVEGDCGIAKGGARILVLVMAVVAVHILPAVLLGQTAALDGTCCAESKYAVSGRELVSKKVVVCDDVAQQRGYRRMREEVRLEGGCKGDFGPGR